MLTKFNQRAVHESSERLTISTGIRKSGLPALWVVWLRCILGGLGLVAWVAVSRQWQTPTRSELRWLLLGGLALIINWLCLFRAYHYSGIAIATVVYHVQPFLLLLLAALLQGEALPLRRMPWLLLALVGVVLSSGWLGADGPIRHRGKGLAWPCWPPACMPWPR